MPATTSNAPNAVAMIAHENRHPQTDVNDGDDKTDELCRAKQQRLK